MVIRYSKKSLKFLSRLDNKSVLRIRAAAAARLIDMLPESEQSFAYEFIKKLVRACDPDYTRLTPQESLELAQAENSGFIDEDDVDWDNLSKYAE